MLVMALCSTNGLSLYTTRFNFFFIFEHNCKFYEFILFPCQIIILLARPIEGKQSRENTQRWKKAYLDMLNELVI